MKIAIAKEQIISGLQAVQNIVSSRTTLPILSNVLLKAEDGRLSLTATDLDVTVSCSVEATVEQPGGTTVPVKRLFGIVRELPTEEIELEVDEKKVTSLRSGEAFYKINGLPAEEYPPLPEFQEDKSLAMSQETIKNMLKRTSFAISTDETRYVLNGIFLKLSEEKIMMVATDGRRLALAEEEITSEIAGEFIIPTKAVNELNRLLQGSGEITVRFTDNQAAFNLTNENGFNILLITKLVEGSYPNYKQVIPTDSQERVTLVREELLAALRRAEFMTNDKSNSVKLKFAKNNLTITANTPEVGEGRESIAVNYDGKEVSIAFNPAYFMDPLKALDDDEVYLELTDELSPGVLKINGPFLYVLMPMRMS